MRVIGSIGPALVLAIAVVGLALPSTARGAEPVAKVAIIVGPVGEQLTPVYIGLAEAAAFAAESRGAVVARAYSPNATAANVLAAVEGANIVIYLGHGVGTPNPYLATDPAGTNGWGLQGPNARGDHSDSWADGTLAYYGEAWIAENARPAPGWVMIYSNACYAAGAGEPQLQELPTPDRAAERVAAYSRTPLGLLGASAYFATDFYEGAARLVGTLLDQPDLPYGQVFAAEPLFDPAAVAAVEHAVVPGADVWLHSSAYFDGAVDYWYAFAGNADATFGGATVPTGIEPAVPAALVPPPAAVDGVVTGVASYFAAPPVGWEGMAAVTLPAEIGGAIPADEPTTVEVCADRCVTLPVVDACPCYVGTVDQRVANLSMEAWAAITDRPFSDGLVAVTIDVRPESVREQRATPDVELGR